jgi:hypothetical protein
MNLCVENTGRTYTAVFLKHEKYLLRLSGFKIFCLCLSHPTEDTSSRQLNLASSCSASIKPPTGPRDSASYHRKLAFFLYNPMPTSLPSAKALMTHADDPRHIVYATWVIPKFFPYMRDLLCVLHLTLCVTPTHVPV